MGKIKKLISAVLTSVMFLSVFAGCGKNEGNSSSQQQDLQTSKANVETTTAKEEKEVKLTWALWDYEKTPYYKALIEEYKKIKPNVTIKYKDLGSSNYQTVLGTQLAGGDSGLDILSVKDIPGYSAMVNAGQLEDLSDFIKKYNIDTSKYSGTTEQIAVDGKLYALPFRSDFWVVFYNKDLFDKAGVAYPTNDMTMKDYDAIARKMTSGSGSTKVYGAHYHTWRSAVQLLGFWMENIRFWTQVRDMIFLNLITKLYLKNRMTESFKTMLH